MTTTVPGIAASGASTGTAAATLAVVAALLLVGLTIAWIRTATTATTLGQQPALVQVRLPYTLPKATATDPGTIQPPSVLPSSRSHSPESPPRSHVSSSSTFLHSQLTMESESHLIISCADEVVLCDQFEPVPFDQCAFVAVGPAPATPLRVTVQGVAGYGHLWSCVRATSSSLGDVVVKIVRPATADRADVARRVQHEAQLLQALGDLDFIPQLCGLFHCSITGVWAMVLADAGIPVDTRAINDATR